MPYNLFGFPVNCVLAAVIAEFLQFHSGWIVPAILFAGVIAFLTLGARESDNRSNIFFL